MIRGGGNYFGQEDSENLFAGDGDILAGCHLASLKDVTCQLCIFEGWFPLSMCRYKTRERVYASIKQEKWIRAWRWEAKGHLWGGVNCLQGCLPLRAEGRLCSELLSQVHRWPPSSQCLTHCLFVSVSHWIRAHPWMGDKDSNISFLGDINSTHNSQCWEVGLYHLGKGKSWKVFD